MGFSDLTAVLAAYPKLRISEDWDKIIFDYECTEMTVALVYWCDSQICNIVATGGGSSTPNPDAEDVKVAIDEGLSNLLTREHHRFNAVQSLVQSSSRDLYAIAAEHHPGEWVLLKGSRVVGHFTDREEATQKASAIEKENGYRPSIVSPGSKKLSVRTPFRG